MRTDRLWVATAMLALAPLAGCGDLITVTNANAPRTTAAFVRHLGLPVRTARVELYDYQAGLDDNARLVLVMADADWAAMRRAPTLAGIAPDGWRDGTAVDFPDDAGAWTPHAQPDLVTADRWLPNAEALRIGYAPAGQGLVRVFIFWNQT